MNYKKIGGEGGVGAMQFGAEAAIVIRVPFDPEADAGYIYVRAGRELNTGELNISASNTNTP